VGDLSDPRIGADIDWVSHCDAFRSVVRALTAALGGGSCGGWGGGGRTLLYIVIVFIDVVVFESQRTMRLGFSEVIFSGRSARIRSD
jgi:hypothetical protein